MNTNDALETTVTALHKSLEKRIELAQDREDRLGDATNRVEDQTEDTPEGNARLNAWHKAWVKSREALWALQARHEAAKALAQVLERQNLNRRERARERLARLQEAS